MARVAFHPGALFPGAGFIVTNRSLTSLRARLIKTGARLVRHGRYTIFQMAAAALPRKIVAGLLDLINGLRGPPGTAVPA